MPTPPIATRNAAIVAIAVGVALMLFLLPPLIGGTDEAPQPAPSPAPAAATAPPVGGAMGVVGTDARRLIRALDKHFRVNGQYPALYPEPTVLLSRLGPDSDTSLVWAWVNSKGSRFRFCLAYRNAHAYYDSRGTFIRTASPRCPEEPSDAWANGDAVTERY